MRTKQEVIDFLESKVGTKVKCVGNPSLDGQCVTLIKALMEFLGVPNPYKARGHANTAISAYLNEGIADPGTGFISVFSNKKMAGGVGHIWCNAGEGDGVYYESNGVKPLIVTKGKTYSYDTVCNFDKYIKEPEPTPEPSNDILDFLNAGNSDEAKKKLIEHLGQKDSKCNWGSDKGAGYLGQEREKVRILTEENDNLRGENTSVKTSYSDLQKKTDNFKSQLAQKLGCEATESVILGEIEKLIDKESGYIKKVTQLEKAYYLLETEKKDEITALRSEIQQLRDDNERKMKMIDNLEQRIDAIETPSESTKRIMIAIEKVLGFFKGGK